ncbi:MAG: hypothetical protein GY906_07390 [bacterium]|nr:hypothetical protein [bacterium]
MNGTSSWSAPEQLITRAMRDLLPRIAADDLATAVIRPMQLFCGSNGAANEVRGDQESLPREVWRILVNLHPEIAAFPLGSVTRRSVLRVVHEWVAGRDQPEMLATLVVDKSRSEVVRELLGIWLAEAALFNLRGGSRRPQWDLGLAYHDSLATNIETVLKGGSIPGQEGTVETGTGIRRRLVDAGHAWSERLTRRWGQEDIPTARQVVDAFCTELGVVTLPPGIRPRRGRPFTVVGMTPEKAETEVGIESISPDGSVVSALPGNEQNVRLDIKPLADVVGSKEEELSGKLRDLLEIAATIYLSDIYVKRDSLLARDLNYLIPVRYPDLWKEEAERLAALVGFMSQNRCRFRFVAAECEASENIPVSAAASPNDCVMLFSGGLDSFLGLSRLLSEDSNGRIYLVRHCPSTSLRSLQNRLVEGFSVGNSDRLVDVPLSVGAAGKKIPPLFRLGNPPAQILYQHTRSFLFLTLAAVSAISRGIRKIYLFENGPVAINPSFCEAAINTRTAHPNFVSRFVEMLARVFGSGVEIENPYLFTTKGEALKAWGASFAVQLRTTNSCWAYARVANLALNIGLAKGEFNGRHCGRCIPCLWRRVAFASAGMQGLDDSYLTDAVLEKGNSDMWEKWMRRTDCKAVLDQVQFCVEAVEHPTVLSREPDFLDLEGGIGSKARDVYLRFCRELLASVQSDSKLNELISKSRPLSETDA